MTNSSLVACTTGKSEGFAPLRDAAGIDAGLTPRIRDAGPVAHQSADFSRFTVRKCGRNPVARRQIDQLDAPSREKSISGDKKGIRPLAHERCECCLDFLASTGIE